MSRQASPDDGQPALDRCTQGCVPACGWRQAEVASSRSLGCSSGGADPHFSLQLHPNEHLRQVINCLGLSEEEGDRSTKASARLTLYLFHVQLQVRRQEIYQTINASIQRQY